MILFSTSSQIYVLILFCYLGFAGGCIVFFLTKISSFIQNFISVKLQKFLTARKIFSSNDLESPKSKNLDNSKSKKIDNFSTNKTVDFSPQKLDSFVSKKTDSYNSQKASNKAEKSGLKFKNLCAKIKEKLNAKNNKNFDKKNEKKLKKNDKKNREKINKNFMKNLNIFFIVFNNFFLIFLMLFVLSFSFYINLQYNYGELDFVCIIAFIVFFILSRHFVKLISSLFVKFKH